MGWKFSYDGALAAVDSQFQLGVLLMRQPMGVMGAEPGGARAGEALLETWGRESGQGFLPFEPVDGEIGDEALIEVGPRLHQHS